MGALAIPTLIKDAPWILCGLLALALAICFAAYKTEVASLADYKTAQAAAVVAAQKKADALADELIIAQAQAMAVTQQKVVTYVDRIQSSPDDVARRTAASLGVRDIINGSVPASPSGPASRVPGPSPGPGPH